MTEWMKEDQDRVVAARREVAADFQQARRHGPRWLAWIFSKLADAALWIEREGAKLRRGFQ